MDPSPLAVETVLVPVDGSDEATTAAEYAITIAGEYGGSVHAMYVLGEVAARAVDAGRVDDDDVAAESRSYLDSVVGMGEDAGVPTAVSVAYGFSPRRKTVHPGSVILDTAEQVDADFLVIPREWSEESAAVLGKAAEYVLLYASQPVLSV